MAKPDLDIDSLSPVERLALIGELWDSLDEGNVSVTDEQRIELRRRQVLLAERGPVGRTIQEIKAGLLNSAS